MGIYYELFDIYTLYIKRSWYEQKV